MIWRALFIILATFITFVIYVNWFHAPTSITNDCFISYVYDGDTVEISCNGKKTSARMRGYDTPEIFKPKCADEAVLGFKAKERLQSLIEHANKVEILRFGLDKYKRRLIDLKVDGRNVSKTLILEKLARNSGYGKRANWCEQ